MKNKKLSKNNLDRFKFSIPLFNKNSLLKFVSGVGKTHLLRTNNKSDQDELKNNLNQVEWFYKGNGTILNPTNSILKLPRFSNSITEEAEIVMIYLIDKKKKLHRIGYSLGNECTDPNYDKKNLNYFNQNKLRNCSIGADIILDSLPDNIKLNVKIQRNENTIWEQNLETGRKNMLFSLENIENTVFKHEQFLYPGMIHYLFLGSPMTSFSSGILIKNNDIISISSEPFLFTLSNKVNLAES